MRREVAVEAPKLGVALVAIVAIAFTIEAALGFGATVVTVALGSLLWSIEPLLAVFVPVNLVLSSVLSARNARMVDVRTLSLRVLPLALLGLPFGMLALDRLPERWLKLAFGFFVVTLALIELARQARLRRAAAGGDAKVEPVGRVAGVSLLVLGGAIHGAFATGGPMIVYVLGRTLGADKGRFRATLSALWLLLNLALVTKQIIAGVVNLGTLRVSAALAVPLLVGLLAGEWLHRRVDGRRFQTAVFAMLAVAGTVIVARALR
ncbi:MAG: sulfite exporter TauE/SafE family protein [Polyangiaceae bacterium]